MDSSLGLSPVLALKKYKRNVPIRSWRRKAPTAPSAKLASHTRLLATIVTCVNCLLFALVLLFSFTQKTALSSYILRYRSLVFCVWKPCGCSTSDCAVLLRSRRTKRSGIMREMSYLCEHRVCPPAERFRGFPQTKCRGGME